MAVGVIAPGECPRCEASGFESLGPLAAHLIDEHGRNGTAALTEARTVFPHTNGDAMRPCTACGQDGHRSDNAKCPKRGGAKPTHDADPAPRRAAKRRPITRRHPLPKKPKAESNGLVSEIAALGAVVEALTPLDASSRQNVLGCVCKLLAIEPAKLKA